MTESVPLAIVGLSCLFPKADDLQAYWSNIKQGVDAITPLPDGSHWKSEDYFNTDPKSPDRTYARRGGFLSPVDFNPMEFGIAPKDIEATDTTQLLGMVAASRALADAGYDKKPFNRQRTSVLLGVTGALELVIPLGARLGHPIWRRALKEAGVDETVAEDVVQRISDGYVPWQENSFPGLLGNVAAGRIASRLDLGGTNCVVDAACASSFAALHLAAMELQAGRSDMVITGGVDTFNDIFMYMCFSKTPALSPSGDAKPFDKDCDGTILGEGLGMVVLKRLADAERDGDKIYCVLRGIGSSSDGRGGAIYEPRSEGQIQAVERAYAAAAVTPDTVELIEAHGTGTKVGDATELRSLKTVFSAAKNDGTPWVALGSVKSQIGHTKAAAGVAGLIKAALALEHKVLPPTIKVAQPLEDAAPGRSPFYVNTTKRPWLPRAAHPRRAGVSAFGFGGTNFHCLLEEHGSARQRTDWNGDVEILALTADGLPDLRAQLAALPTTLPWTELRRRAYASRQQFRTEAAFRVVLPLSKDSALGALRDSALMMLDKYPAKTAWSLPTGVAFGAGARNGKLGGLFPGQGSQYVGMFRDLACQFPEVLNALADADRVFAEQNKLPAQQRLSDFIYPHPAFNDETRIAQESALKATEIAQPALGAVSLAALGLVESFGVVLEATSGHSYGELPALWGAGRLNAESLHLLSNVRGRLMASVNGHSDRGSMLAVQAGEETVAELARMNDSQLVIANRNSPNQFVLAGPKRQIEFAAGEAAKRSIRARVLPVSAAFHSELVADAREPFAAVLEGIAFNKGRIPVYANSTAKAYPTGVKSMRDVLASQIVKPVDFIAQIQAMHADGVTTFLELGAGHVLSDLVQAILPDRDIVTIALDASRGTRSGTFDLAVALSRLAALGHQVDLSRWETAPAPAPASGGKAAFTVPISGANVRTTKTPVRPPVSRRETPAASPSPSATPAQRLSTMPAPSQPSMVRSTEPALSADVAAALQTAQQGMIALQKLQEQTAQLHQQFLAGQDAARRTLEDLLNQRRALSGLPPIASSPAFEPLQFAPPPSTAMARPAAPVVGPSPIAKAQARNPEVVPAPSRAPSVQRTPAPSAAPAAPARPAADAAATVAAAVLSVVSDKTGYPAEMLTLDMGLDSDLGIDSIKRVEIMAALRSRLPDAPEVKPEHLGSLQSLQDVVSFLSAGARVSTELAPVPVSVVDKAPVAASGPAASEISRVLLSVVSDKTGYPVEMLTLDMGLDSDLGVDSIKRVEIMAAMRTQLPGTPEIRPEHLGTLQTLSQVVEFLSASSATRSAPQAQEVASPSGLGTTEAAKALLAVVSEKTGYPVEMLTLDMGLDSDLGVDSIKRVEIMAALRTQLPGAPEIKPEHLGSLRTLQEVVDFLCSTASVASKPAAPSRAEATPAPSAARSAAVAAVSTASQLSRQTLSLVPLPAVDARPVIALPSGSVVWLADENSRLGAALASSLEARGLAVRRGSPAQLLSDRSLAKPSALVLLWPETKAGDDFLKASFQLIQSASPALRAGADHGTTALVSISRLDGQFGLGGLTKDSNPISGALAGLIKTARHEWKGVHCKAIDIDAGADASSGFAGQLVDEMLRSGPIEVGLVGGKRFSLEIETTSVEEGREPALKPGDIVVVTGGARGVTATSVIALARRCALHFVLLGRSALSESEPSWLSVLKTESDIKKALLAYAEGDRSPKRIEAAYRDVMAQREIRSHLAEIRATGAVADYVTADVRDGAAVEVALAKVRATQGPIRGVIHGAGVLADKLIEQKTEEQFDLVYSTKVQGLRNLLTATSKDKLKLIALFSSYTGRFGRSGQVDYAAANEVLNKMAQVESRRRPQCRVVAFNWGPWNGGMVTEGLRKIFEREGVGLIETQAGADFFVRDVLAPAGSAVEVLALARSSGSAPSTEAVPPTVILPSVREASAIAFAPAFDREISLRALPCLASHVMNGRAVMPAALIIEWLAHGATHSNPGLVFHGFNAFKVLKGLVLEGASALHVTVSCSAPQARDGMLSVPVQLTSRNDKGKVTLHATAEVVLADVLPAAPIVVAAVHRNGTLPGSVYGDGRLFHGTDFHAIEALEACNPGTAAALVHSSPAPKDWIQHPFRTGWLVDPMALDAAFQLMILWSNQHRSAPSLPCALRSFRQFAPFPKRGGSRVVARITSGDTPVAVADLQFFDRNGVLLALGEGYEFVVDPNLREAFRHNQLPA